MTSYITINNTEVDPDSPITADLMTKLRDNPIAISESVTGAPVSRSGWHPYNSTVNGTGNGIIYSFAVNGSVSSVETPAFVDGYEYMIIYESLSSSVASANLTAALYRETSAAYASSFGITSGQTAIQAVSGYIEIRYPRKTSPVHYAVGASLIDATNTTTASGALFSATQHTTPQKIGKVQISLNTTDGGIIYLYRRAVNY